MPARLVTTRVGRARRAIAAGAAGGLALATACSGAGGGDAAREESETPVTTTPMPVLSPRSDPLPVVTPHPRTMEWLGPDVTVSRTVTIVAPPNVDRAAVDVVVEVLEAAGAVEVVRPVLDEADDDAAGTTGDTGDDGAEGGDGDRDGTADGADGADRLTVHVGPLADADIADRLGDIGVQAPADLPAEGYVLAAATLTDGSGTVVLAGADGAGTFYAAQTLRQLTGDGAVAGVSVVDQPAMGHRGAIEGFYGSPWTTDERLDQLAFYGRFKLNTYIYAPKDDPYHRDRWREPYPADRLAALGRLADAAAANHVRFTFAVSPGVSVCYSDPADLDALVAKLDAVYGLGVRSFSIALDDIDHTRWNCDGDAARFGPPSTEAAARAQAELLNAVQTRFVATRADVRPLEMVPTEYRGTADSPYRQVLRETLDPAVEVMWTGAYVVPDQITVAQAEAAAATFGRPLYLWDNTPVNDYPATEGRLILAPYARREPGLSAQLTGIVLNPMNQAAASKVQLVGGADFAWNDAAYDPARAQRAAADHLAGGDPRTTEALLAFLDLEHLAPTSARDGRVSLPQAPVLALHLDAFRTAWASGARQEAVDGLRPHAELLAAAPARIRSGVGDAAFVADCGPWLDAAELWGQALVARLDGIAAGLAGDAAGAAAARASVDDLVARASAIRTVPGETLPQGPVRVGDGVLDAFLAETAGLG